MYHHFPARTRTARRTVLVTAIASTLVLVGGAAEAPLARAQVHDSASVVRKISDLSEKLELTTNSSRILTLDKNIPRVQVNNPELLAVTPLSATQVQISAKKAGVTQVNLWDEDGNIHTVDVMIYGDARELEVALQTQFPNSTIKVYRYSESLVLKGFVDRPDHVGPIMRLAEDYAPKVVNNISVGGVQQVLLKVRVYEVSRTKLRNLGVDWAFLSGNRGFAINSVSGLITGDGGPIRDIITTGGETFAFGIVDGNQQFFGILEALQQCRVAKILAEPNLVAVSGRPAQFNVGGEFPVLIPQSLGTTSIEFKPYGTQVDFLPIVLGNGMIRLEVRPRISEIDPGRSIVLDTINVPALTVRQVDTAVEMQAGQTFALAGLVQERTETLNRGLPYLSDLPVIGVPFRRTRDEVNEIELLILVTPEFVDPMDPHEAPCGGPGYVTTTPDNCDLYCGGHVEVPAHVNPIRGPLACGECGGVGGQCGCGPNGGCQSQGSIITDGAQLPGGVGYDDGGVPTPSDPTIYSDQGQTSPMTLPPASVEPQGVPSDIPLPSEAAPPEQPAAGAQPVDEASTYRDLPGYAVQPQYTAPRPYSPSRQPVFVRNTASPNNPQPPAQTGAPGLGENGLIGPVGYDVE
jgi:pilus assembly protein CpaC